MGRTTTSVTLDLGPMAPVAFGGSSATIERLCQTESLTPTPAVPAREAKTLLPRRLASQAEHTRTAPLAISPAEPVMLGQIFLAAFRK